MDRKHGNNLTQQLFVSFHDTAHSHPPPPSIIAVLSLISHLLWHL
jgi:hypothetical protein